MTGKYRPEIDGLRTLAVIPVILFHAGFSSFAGGFVGVDVFFVISGFLITTVIVDEQEGGGFSIARFYERRARRILPALFLVLACCVPFAWAWMLPEAFTAFFRNLAGVVVFSSNILFWREAGYFDQAAELKPLLHTWSLAVEEQYYLLFPLVLMIAARWSRRATVLVLAAVFAISLGLAQWASSTMPVANFFLLPFRAWELMIGALCAFALREGGQAALTPAVKQIGSLAGLLLILVAIFTFDGDTPFPSLWALAPTGGAALIILCAAPGTIAHRLLSLRAMVGIGLISYSAYLWHQPLFAFARLRSIVEPSPAAYIALALASLALAYLSWRFVETPFRNRGAVPLPRLTLATSSSAVALLAVGLVLGLSNGAPQRFGPRMAAALEVKQIKHLNGRCDFDERIGDRARLEACISRKNVVYLIGDSHARALVPRLREKLRPKGYRMVALVKSGCYPIEGLSRHPDDPRDACTRFKSQVWATLERHPAPVILVTRWRLNLEGTRYDNREGGVERGGTGKVFPQPGVRGSRYEITRSRLEALAKRMPLVLVGPIPEAGWDVPSTMIKHHLFEHRTSPLTTSFSVYSRAVGPIRRMLETVDRARLVDPAAMICRPAEGRCLDELDGVPLYVDDDHPSKLLGDMIASAVVADIADVAPTST